MYARAPHRTTNGTTLVPKLLDVRAPLYGSLTIGEAFSKKDEYTNQINIMKSETNRYLMQAGRLGENKFFNTPYRAVYRGSIAHGHVYRLKIKISSWQQGLYFVEAIPFGIGYTGGYNSSGYVDPTSLIDPFGTSINPIALANRTLIGSNMNQCVAEAKNKLLRNQFDMSEFLAGLPDTVRMIAESSLRVLYAWRSVRNGNYGLAAKHLGLTRSNLNFKSASSAWLEFQYGWRPLLSDIFGGVKYVNGLLNEPGDHVFAVRRLTKQLIFPRMEPNENWADTQGTAEAWTSCEVKLKGRVAEPTIALLNSLQLLNPAYSAWVAAPFSFVIDWLVPVADWLEALTSTIGLEFTSGYRTMRTYGSTYATVSKPARDIDNILEFLYLRDEGTASAGIDYAVIDRIAYSDWPIPSLYFRFPFSSNERIASAIALTRSTVSLRR